MVCFKLGNKPVSVKVHIRVLLDAYMDLIASQRPGISHEFITRPEQFILDDPYLRASHRHITMVIVLFPVYINSILTQILEQIKIHIKNYH